MNQTALLVRLRYTPGTILGRLLAAGALVVPGIVRPPEVRGDSWPAISLQEVASGLDLPVNATHAGDGSGRLFIVEQRGRIQVLSQGVIGAVPFLDISDRVSCCGERGLLSAAFPPAYSARRHFYVDYTDEDGDTVVSRFHLQPGEDRADPSSEEVILTVSQPFANHNGGQLAFGPDGYLYVGLGDGGSAGDPQNNAQNAAVLLGKLLRIDVESKTAPYAIPASNPFAGVAGVRPEIWALGLRNPWRFSFDRATGDLYIGDVGQNAVEEIDFQTSDEGGGQNYGWKVYEGSRCYVGSCGPTGWVMPVAEYSHTLGCSVTGGFVSRSKTSPTLAGIYVYGDYCSGRIWGLRREGDVWKSQQLADTTLSISSFGEDEVGRMYVADYGGGRLYLLTGEAGEAPLAYLVPAVAHLPGLEGSFWRTDLALVNAGSEAARLTLRLATEDANLDVTITLEPGETREWRDVAESLFDVGPDEAVGGVVKIGSDRPLAGGARTYNETSLGRYGQAIPLLTAPDALWPGQAGVLTQLKSDAQYYSNVGVVNLGAVEATVRVTLRDSAGDAIGDAVELTVPVDGWRQVTDVFSITGAGGQSVAWASVEVLSAEGRAWIYASVVDRSSRDPITVAVVDSH